MDAAEYLDIGSSERFNSAEPRYLTLLGRRVAVWRSDDGTFQAMEMVCRHQNGDLTRGERDGDIVTCPRHGWRYDLATGECLTEAWAGLRRYEVRERAGRLLISPRPIG